mgnify:CR=1 FL=1
MSTVPVRLAVNGQHHEVEVEPRLLLVHLLRDNLGLTGTHVGCDTTNCGACTVMLDGKTVKVHADKVPGEDIPGVERLIRGLSTACSTWSISAPLSAFASSVT